MCALGPSCQTTSSVKEFHMRKVVVAFSLFLTLSLIPATSHAEDVSDECSAICHSYDRCDTTCEVCDSFNPQTNNCEHWVYSSCGDATYGECGGCGISDVAGR